MKILKRFFLGMLPVLAGIATAATFNLFQPATGILKGNASTYVTTAATSTDIIGTFTGTCNNGTYLRGDGTCNTPPGTGVSSVGLTMPTGFNVAGSPVTSSGTLAVSTTLSGVLHGNGTGFTASNVLLGSEVSGTLPVGNGGTGATTLTGVVHGNGAAAFTAGNVALGSEVSGTLPVGNGGSGATTLSGVLHGNGAAAFTAANVALGSEVSGTLPVGNGGTGATTLTGLLKGNGVSAFTAATSADVIGLWSGTCNSTSYLRGDGACAAAGTGTVTSISGGTGITLTPDPITTTGSVALATSEQEASTTSTGTASGCTTSPTQTLRFVKRGNMVIMSMDNPVNCTSNSTSFSLTGAIPAGYQPARVQTCFWRGIDNSVDQMVQVGVSSGSSSLTALTVSASSLWTNSGTKAIGGVGSTCAYALN